MVGKREKKDKVCKAPGDKNGTPCRGKVLAKGLCSRHYQQIYHHGKITNKSRGSKSIERTRVEKEVKKYHGKDAYYDIANKLEAQGFDRTKIRKALWHVIREPKKKARSR